MGSDSTLVFWRYERGRVRLALGDPRGAREELRVALEGARLRGWWPRLGVLRALAWAEALTGDEAARKALVAEAERLAAALPEGLRGFARRFITEARGSVHEAREVY